MYQCPLCKNHFSCQQRLESHLKRKIPCHNGQQPINKITIGSKDLILKQDRIVCMHCQKIFSRKDSLNRHQKHFCYILQKLEETHIKQHTDKNETFLDPIVGHLEESQSTESVCNLEDKLDLLEKRLDEIPLLKKRLDEKDQQIAELIKKPSTNINNNLQIICIGQNDNYLDMLTEKYGNFERALEYIKDCALANLVGDCKLIEKMYMDDQKSAIRYVDKARTKIHYFDQNKKVVVDDKAQFGRKLANNLQNSYLKGVNYLINKNLEDHRCPNKFLEDYDIQTWNQHIYNLSNIQYHKKIINNLNIPIGPGEFYLN